MAATEPSQFLRHPIMRRTICALGISFLMLMALPAGAERSEDKTFTVQIAIIPESLNTKAYHDRGVFWVNTKVTNIGKTDQKIRVWTQYGWSWRSNNDAVMPGTEAAQNIASESVLRPGQVYEGAEECFADPHRKPPLRFHLGFYPTPTRPVSRIRNAGIMDAVSWSNEVVLDR